MTLSLSTIVVGVSTKPPANLPFERVDRDLQGDLAHDEGRRVHRRGHVPACDLLERAPVSPSLPSRIRSLLPSDFAACAAPMIM